MHVKISKVIQSSLIYEEKKQSMHEHVDGVK